MTVRRRSAQALAAAALVLVLAACGSLPTSGPVNAGEQIADDEAQSNPVFIPRGPANGATPQQIVEGFIAAGSGPQGDWETARLFLADGAEWNPRESVTVYRPGDRAIEQTTETTFTLSVTPAATVDETGELSPLGGSGPIPLRYALAQEDGQWRLTDVPAGIVLDSSRFVAVFSSYALQFFDPTWTYLVPDERWFPREYARTRIAEALVNGGPSPWLRGSVASAFTDGARLATRSVPISSSVASVSLQEGARSLDSTVLNRMQTQLEASLDPAGVRGVDMVVGEQVLPATAVTVRLTRVDPNPLAVTDQGFGFVSGSTLEAIPGLSAAVTQIDATDIEVDADRSIAAVRDRSGAVWAAERDGTRTLIDNRPGLVAPSVDPFGYIWTVPESSPGAVIAHTADGTEVPIADAWTGTVQVLAQRISRDGTRVAAIVRDGEGYALWAAGIVRDRTTNAPIGLGERKVLAVLPEPSAVLTWADASTVALLATENGEPLLYTQQIGGFAETDPTPEAITMIAGGSQSGGIRLRDAEGVLYTPRGSANWQQLATGILVLAVQQGLPR